VAALNLPEDLVDFLGAGRALSYDESRCTPKGVTLLPLDRLSVRTVGARARESSDLSEEDPHAGGSGYYRVPAVSLVGTCRNYRPAGLLVWLPDSEVFGSWDDDHHTLWVFPGVNWSRIAADPVPYLNACWSPRRAGRNSSGSGKVTNTSREVVRRQTGCRTVHRSSGRGTHGE
jgi:hypothetical protein